MKYRVSFIMKFDEGEVVGEFVVNAKSDLEADKAVREVFAKKSASVHIDASVSRA